MKHTVDEKRLILGKRLVQLRADKVRIDGLILRVLAKLKAVDGKSARPAE
jgi:hypothetical protein